MRLAHRIFDTRDIFVIHSGVPKRTADAAAKEHSETWINTHLDQKPHRDALVNTCEAISIATEDIIMAALYDDDSMVRLEERWHDLCDLITRTQGLLMSLGFGFPAGDELLGRVVDAFEASPDTKFDGRGRSIGGKLTGGGLGGDLVFFLRTRTADTMQIMYETISTIQKTCGPLGSASPLSRAHILYNAHRDGIEARGAILEKPFLSAPSLSADWSANVAEWAKKALDALYAYGVFLENIRTLTGIGVKRDSETCLRPSYLGSVLAT